MPPARVLQARGCFAAPAQGWSHPHKAPTSKVVTGVRLGVTLRLSLCHHRGEGAVVGAPIGRVYRGGEGVWAGLVRAGGGWEGFRCPHRWELVGA